MSFKGGGNILQTCSDGTEADAGAYDVLRK